MRGSIIVAFVFPKSRIELLASEKEDSELMRMFEEIVSYQNSGVLNDSSILFEFSKEIEASTNTSNMLRTAETAVLQEMSRRYHNLKG